MLALCDFNNLQHFVLCCEALQDIREPLIKRIIDVGSKVLAKMIWIKEGSYLKSKRFDKVGFCSSCAHSPGRLLNKHPLGNHIPGWSPINSFIDVGSKVLAKIKASQPIDILKLIINPFIYVNKYDRTHKKSI
jgi:hypothetical protein